MHFFLNGQFLPIKNNIRKYFKFFLCKGVPYGQHFSNMVPIPTNWKTKAVLKIGQGMD